MVSLKITFWNITEAETWLPKTMDKIPLHYANDNTRNTCEAIEIKFISV